METDLVVSIRGEFIGDNDVRGKEKLDTLLSGDLLKFAGKVKLCIKYFIEENEIRKKSELKRKPISSKKRISSRR